MREALAARADLVDMEGYAVAAACRAAQVPVRLVKLVSDDAGEDAHRTWAESVGDHAETLARVGRASTSRQAVGGSASGGCGCGPTWSLARRTRRSRCCSAARSVAVAPRGRKRK